MWIGFGGFDWPMGVASNLIGGTSVKLSDWPRCFGGINRLCVTGGRWCGTIEFGWVVCWWVGSFALYGCVVWVDMCGV